MKTAQCNLLVCKTAHIIEIHILFNGPELTMGQRANKSGWVTRVGSEYL